MNTRPPDHGTLARYETPCRCLPCTDASRKANQRRRLLKATGRWQPYTDPAPVRAHLAALRDAGLTLVEIVHATATPAQTLDHIRRGDYTRVRTETARRILAVDPARIDAERYLTDATGTRRRLQALYWRGHPTAAICAATGLNERTVRAITRGAAIRVARTTRDAVHDAYRRLADQDPARRGTPDDAVRRARAFARRGGFAPAAAWDDDTIDDPRAVPDLGAETSRREALAEDAAWIAATEVRDPNLIAARLGISRDYLDQVRERTAARSRQLVGVAS